MTVVLAYAGCSTCKKAIKWLSDHGVEHEVRAIVENPPSAKELEAWIPQSGLDVRKWLNTSGQSYRAMGKEKVDAASESQIKKWLTEDGKLVKRPVVVSKDAVLVGFRPEAFEATFGSA